GAAADPGEGQFPPHGLFGRAEGPRHALDPVRDRLYLQPERREVHRFAGRPPAHRRERAARGRYSFREAAGVERLKRVGIQLGLRLPLRWERIWKLGSLLPSWS